MVNKHAGEVRGMFGSVAPRYDFLNHLLSLGIDYRWRRNLRRFLLRELPPRPKILDLCTGTGDVALTLLPDAEVIGGDFCRPMLLRAQAKARSSGRVLPLVEADALRLPFSANSFDAVSIAFGLRNLEDHRKGLLEIHRVVRPGGRVAVLEFAVPPSRWIRNLYLWYFHNILPKVGAFVSGDEGAYSYLPASVHEFLPPSRLTEEMERAGFSRVQPVQQTFGIVYLHLARKP